MRKTTAKKHLEFRSITDITDIDVKIRARLCVKPGRNARFFILQKLSTAMGVDGKIGVVK